jgi:hypothetical protein
MPMVMKADVSHFGLPADESRRTLADCGLECFSGRIEEKGTGMTSQAGGPPGSCREEGNRARA